MLYPFALVALAPVVNLNKSMVHALWYNFVLQKTRDGQRLLYDAREIERTRFSVLKFRPWVALRELSSSANRLPDRPLADGSRGSEYYIYEYAYMDGLIRINCVQQRSCPVVSEKKPCAVISSNNNLSALQ